MNKRDDKVGMCLRLPQDEHDRLMEYCKALNLTKTGAIRQIVQGLEIPQHSTVNQ